MRLRTSEAGSVLLAFTVLASSIALFVTVAMLVDVLVLRPVVLPGADRLVLAGGLSLPTFHDRVAWWNQTTAFESLALVEQGTVEVEIARLRRTGRAAIVSDQYFDVLGIRQAAAGRLFTKADRVDAEISPVVVDAAFAREWFGTPDAAIGADLRLSGLPFRVIGVITNRPVFPRRPEMWILRQPSVPSRQTADVPSGKTPDASQQTSDARRDVATSPKASRVDAGTLFLAARGEAWIGRLALRRSVDSATDELLALLQRLNEEETPKSGVRYGDTITVVSLRSMLARPFQAPLLALLVGGGLVLLLAWANTSTLFLARVLDRRAVFAIQVALGATPKTIVRGLATEAAAFGAVSGLAGGVLAQWALRVVGPLFDAAALASRSFTSDTTAMTVAIILAAGLGMILGLVAAGLPLLMAAVWTDWTVTGHRTGTGVTRRAGRLRKVLTVSQVALAMILIVAAGLALRTFRALSDVDLGFQPGGVLSMRLSLPRNGSADVMRDALIDTLGRPVGTLNVVPLVDELQYLHLKAGEDKASAATFVVDPETLRLLGVRTRVGRTFLSSDRHAVVLSESLARRLWPDKTPVGALVTLDGETQARHVVGMVNDVRSTRIGGREMAGDAYQIYLPREHPYGGPPSNPSPTMTVVLACVTDCGAASREARAIVERAGGQLHWARPLVEALDAALAPSRLRARAAAFYGIASFLLAVGAIYSLMSFVVATRRHEMAVRMTVGASAGSVARALLANSMRIVCTGVVLGAILAFPLFYVVQYLFFGVSIAEPTLYAAAAATLLIGATLATLGPAVRVYRVNPLDELYDE